MASSTDRPRQAPVSFHVLEQRGSPGWKGLRRWLLPSGIWPQGYPEHLRVVEQSKAVTISSTLLSTAQEPGAGQFSEPPALRHAFCRPQSCPPRRREARQLMCRTHVAASRAIEEEGWEVCARARRRPAAWLKEEIKAEKQIPFLRVSLQMVILDGNG